MSLRSVHFIAILLTALALVPAGAHLFALPNKIAMRQGDYFAAQSAYEGWALLGIILIGAILANGSLALLIRNETVPFTLAFAAAICLLARLVVFLSVCFPRTRRPRIGEWPQPAGSPCAPVGNTDTRRARSLSFWPSARRRSRR